MSNKKRILMCAESHSINSGFGLYTREILSRLHKTDKYEIAELSCYNTGQSECSVPWKVYPNAVDKTSQDFTTYNANPINAFGQWRFDKVVLNFRPDITLCTLYALRTLCTLCTLSSLSTQGTQGTQGIQGTQGNIWTKV